MINILLLMAGKGERFKKAGLSTPKPFIEVNGRPMFLNAAESIFRRLKQPVRFIVAARIEHAPLIKAALKDFSKPFEIHFLNQATRGPLETAVQVVKAENILGPLFILDCDFLFDSPDYFSRIATGGIDGAVVYFKSTSPRYSYARLKGREVLETAEKIVLSDCALAGCYFFSSAKIFAQKAQEALDQDMQAEPYIAPLYNSLIKDGYKIEGFPVSRYVSFGTPEELQNSQKSGNGRGVDGETWDGNDF
jgi:NDP-sugar pyrophosphorylase family protein